jgi:lysophospholipase
MGSMVALAYAHEYQHELAGLITSGGGVTRPGEPPPPPRPANQPLDTAFLSRDPAVIAAYVNDPLVYRGPLPQRMALMSFRSRLTEMVPQIKLPILIMAGTDVADGARSQALYEMVGSRDNTLKLYAGLRHEIFNEPEHKQVMADLEGWLEGRV